MKLGKVLNENYVEKTWFAKNYFWAGTFSVILLCVFSFVFGGSAVFDDMPVAYSAVNLSEILNNFAHVNLQHTLLNMLCFLVAGVYFERKVGTIKLLLLIIVIASLNQTGAIGFSLVNYALYSIIIIDYIFLLCKKTERTKFSVISGAVVVALIYLAMCFNGGTSSFGFEWYPYDLFNNGWHVQGAFFGIWVGLLLQIWGLGKKAMEK